MRLAVKGVVRLLSSTGVRLAGVDVTESFVRRRTVVIAPHPDDETLGCGATIAKMRALGTPVTVIFISAGGRSPRPVGMSLDQLLELRRTESVRALDVLGVEPAGVTYLDFEDGALTERGHDIANALTDLLRAACPEQVLVTSASDRHPDHIAVGLAARAAVPRGADKATLFEYPIWQRIPALTIARDAARRALTSPNTTEARKLRPRLVATDGFISIKEAALRLYQSQLPHFPAGFVGDFLLPVETFVEVTSPRG